MGWMIAVMRENENSVSLPLMLTAEYFICRLLDVASMSIDDQRTSFWVFNNKFNMSLASKGNCKEHQMFLQLYDHESSAVSR